MKLPRWNYHDKIPRMKISRWNYHDEFVTRWNYSTMCRCVYYTGHTIQYTQGSVAARCRPTCENPSGSVCYRKACGRVRRVAASDTVWYCVWLVRYISADRCFVIIFCVWVCVCSKQCRIRRVWKSKMDKPSKSVWKIKTTSYELLFIGMLVYLALWPYRGTSPPPTPQWFS